MGERSWWAWGDAARLPDAEARGNLADMACALLGVSPGPRRAPPRLADATLPAPRIPCPLPFATDAPLDRAGHTYGKAWPDQWRASRGDLGPAPDAVAYPRDEDEVRAALDWARGAGVAVVPFGGGTSVVGGVECDGAGRAGVLSLDLTRMDKVLEVDSVALQARIQAGAMGPALEAQLGAHGLTLRHYPQSFEFSTLGGWLATRAGGHFATLETHIDDLVSSIRMVTPAGPWESRRLPASGAGPSPDRLVLGSEGILGVITEAWMRVRPRPTCRASATVAFTDWDLALDAVRRVAQARLHPSNCRLIDRREALLNGIDDGSSHLLLLAFEGTEPVHEPLMKAALSMCTPGGVVTAGPTFSTGGARGGAAGGWRQAFLHAPYLQPALMLCGLMVDTFETACTWDRLAELHRRVVKDFRGTLREVCGAGLVTCRLTHVYPDGAAPYFTFIAPCDPEGGLEQWRAVKAAAMDVVVDAGGTVTHHHAVGRLHRPGYDRQRPALFAAGLEAVKGVVDPTGMLNPGVLIG